MKALLEDFEALVKIAKRVPSGIEAMTVEERRAYNRAKKAESRDRQKAALADGKALVHTDTVRDILADLAIAMLATDALGSETLMSGLRQYFKDRQGWPVQIKQKAKSGKLKLKVIA